MTSCTKRLTTAQFCQPNNGNKKLLKKLNGDNSIQGFSLVFNFDRARIFPKFFILGLISLFKSSPRLSIVNQNPVL